jgi:ATP-binding cassette subfamily C (CFTR/MRP) protein 4
MLSILNGIHVIKMYVWEKSFAKIINDIRKHEIQAIKKGYNVKATLLSFRILTKLALFASLLVYVLTGQSITAQKAFVVISYLNVINGSMVEFWPLALSSVAEALVSFKRVQEFLAQSNKTSEKIGAGDDQSLTLINNNFIINGVKEKVGPESRIMLKNVKASWHNEEGDLKFGLSSINLNIEDGITAIIGPVGSGKTTLLDVILKELNLTSGELKVNGRISYAPQEAWIFQGSVKNNILFTEPYDEARYKNVVEVCALLPDFELFPHGDETIVGERGVSLSGGQKARISLARAVYKNVDIYLLDDPLSAVDVHVGKHIFENCINAFLGVSITFYCIN